MISDGVHFQQAMLATQLNELVNDGKLQPKCVVRLNEYICNTVHGRRYAHSIPREHGENRSIHLTAGVGVAGSSSC